MTDQPTGDNRVEPPVKKYNLPIPEPINLWKWAARNSSRHSDGLPLGFVDFYKRALRLSHPLPGEAHGEFAKRALLTETRAILSARRAAGGIIPLWVEELLAVEIAQTANAAAAEKMGNL